jgi:peptide/nickel transport system substrate-binding protein
VGNDTDTQRSVTRRELVAGAAAAGATGLVVGRAPRAWGAATVRRAASQGTLVTDLELESDTFNALDRNYHHLRWVIDQIQETLYSYDEKLVPVPRLADGMPRTIDGLTTEVRIKRGIRFHNGDELTAEHVAATFNEARAGRGRIWVGHLVPIADVQATGSHTVRFTLKQPWSLLLDKLIVIPVMHKDFLPERGQAMGTGPFVWAERTQGTEITLRANPRYRNGAPQLAEIVYRITPAAASRLINLLRGETQLLGAVPYANVTQFQRNGSIDVQIVSAPINFYFWISMRVFPDVRVRQAIANSIDRQRVRDVVYSGHADIGQGPIGPAVEGWQWTAKDIYPARPDFERARALLRAAGVTSFSFTLLNANDQTSRDTAAILQEDWAKIGVRANLEFLELGAWQARWTVGDFGICTLFSMDGIAFGRSADRIVGIFESGAASNRGKFTNRIVNKLVGEALAVPNRRTRARLYAQASDVIARRGGTFPPVYPRFVVATRKEVQGLPTAPLGINKLDLYPVSLRG